MIKLLHFADLHLGASEGYGHTDPASGLSTRLLDFLEAFDYVVDYALGNGIDLVLFCGDAYKSRNPSQTQQREFARRIRRLAAAGIRGFLLVGNHDLPNAVGRATAVEIFDTLEVSYVTVAGRPGIHHIETKNGTLQIVALPWARRSALLSREDYKNLTPDQLNQRLEETLTEWLMLQVASLDPGLPTVLAGHLAHSGAIPGSERTMIMGRDYILLQSNLGNPAFDYVALGHVHKQQAVDRPVPIVYPGSLQSIDFGDEGLEKGFYVVELDGARSKGQRVLSYDFCPVKARRFLTIEVNADTDNPTQTVLRALARKDVTDAIVRVRIRVSSSHEGLIQEAEVRKALAEAHFATINKEVEREQRLRLGGYSAEGITPLEALKVYLESKKTPPDRAKELLEYGDRLIRQSLAPE